MDEIRELLESEGWKIVREYIEKKIRDHKNQLITCPLDKVEGHRRSIDTYSSVLLYVNELAFEGGEI